MSKITKDLRHVLLRKHMCHADAVKASVFTTKQKMQTKIIPLLSASTGWAHISLIINNTYPDFCNDVECGLIVV